MKNWIGLGILVLVCAVACRQDLELPEAPQPEVLSLNLPDELLNYDFNLPDHVADNLQLAVYAYNNTPSYNSITDAGATLGRVLFYDPRLSEDNSISCSSCHFQENAFSDPKRFSVGINGQETPRNSMSLLNQRYYQDFFWDMRADGLEAQVLLPIQDHGEMGSDLEELIAELNGYPEYASLFEAAFESPEITEESISYALAQFIRSIVSFDSKYDQNFSNDFQGFSQLELDGKDLFFGGDLKCNQCHTGLNFFTRLEAVSNGLEAQSVDSGLYNKTGTTTDIGRFKIVSLRNLTMTAPYMHDGRFETLEEVVEHYASNIQPHANLDERLTVENMDGGTPLVFDLTDYEKESLVAFLHTLTDYTVIEDERFSDPFVRE